VVKEIAGEEGVTVCRSLLDGIEDDREADLHNRITEGRCTVCRGSTYEDDCAEDDEIILCDGCNAEAHMRCLNMTTVCEANQ
jgi:NAD-dependent SIR2 family protein deacetylase